MKRWIAIKSIVNTVLLLILLIVVCGLFNEVLRRASTRDEVLLKHDAMVTREIKNIKDGVSDIQERTGQRSITIYTDLPHVKAPKAPEIPLKNRLRPTCSNSWFMWSR